MLYLFFYVNEKERPRQPTKFQYEDSKALLDEDCCQTEQLSDTLKVTNMAVSKRLHYLGLV